MNRFLEFGNNFLEVAGNTIGNISSKSITDNVGNVWGNITGGRGGAIYEINGKRLTEIKLIAEGGFGFVYLVRDDYNQTFALKRMFIQERDRIDAMKTEIDVMQKLKSNPNIVRLESYKINENRNTRDTEVLMLMEFCSGGSVLDIMNARGEHTRLDEREILSIFQDVCNGVLAMHQQQPPIAHRDLKIENILYCENSQRYKLCDFGSATIKTFNTSRGDQERGRAEDDIDMFTTLFYRAPEMVDLYRGSVIDEKVDVWALGCLLFKMAFYVDPFDGGSLQIINNNYKIPENSKYSDNLHRLIQFVLIADPKERPSIQMVLNFLQEIKGSRRSGLQTFSSNSGSNSVNNSSNSIGRPSPNQIRNSTGISSNSSTPNSNSPLNNNNNNNNSNNSGYNNNNNNIRSNNTPNSTPPNAKRNIFDILGNETSSTPTTNNSNNNNFNSNNNSNNNSSNNINRSNSLNNSNNTPTNATFLDDFNSWGNSPSNVTPTTSTVKVNNNNNNNNNKNSNNNNVNSFTFDNNDFEFESFVSPTTNPIPNFGSSTMNNGSSLSSGMNSSTGSSNSGAGSLNSSTSSIHSFTIHNSNSSGISGGSGSGVISNSSSGSGNGNSMNNSGARLVNNSRQPSFNSTPLSNNNGFTNNNNNGYNNISTSFNNLNISSSSVNSNSSSVNNSNVGGSPYSDNSWNTTLTPTSTHKSTTKSMNGSNGMNGSGGMNNNNSNFGFGSPNTGNEFGSFIQPTTQVQYSKPNYNINLNQAANASSINNNNINNNNNKTNNNNTNNNNHSKAFDFNIF